MREIAVHLESGQARRDAAPAISMRKKDRIQRLCSSC